MGKTDRDFYKKLRKSDDNEVVSWIGGEVNDLNPNTSLFVTRSGNIIDVRKSTEAGRTHEDYIWNMIKVMTDVNIEDLSAESLFRDVLKALNMRGWIRMGTGSNATNGIYYAILPDFMELTPTGFQYACIEDFINLAYDEGKSYVIIYFSPYDIGISRTYNFKNYTTEDIMKIIKRYYSSGKVYESLKARRRGLNEGNENYITLYHNTPYRNCKSILKNGLRVDNSQSERASGWAMTWATDHPIMDGGWGGNIVKFRLPKSYHYEKVNDDQYIIFDDIEPELIDSIDYLIGGSGTGHMHLSELDEYIDEYGRDKVRKVLTIDHNEAIPLEDIKKMTPQLGWAKNESLNEVYPNKGESKKDFISRFMSVTKDEYPNLKQRFAIANSYWERR